MSEQTRYDDKISEPHQESDHVTNYDFVDTDINIITSQD